MSWRNCNASLTLVQAINEKWPNRDRASDGTIGNAAHATRFSDHNPWVVVDGVGVVRARDIDKDGIDAAWLAEQLRILGAMGDMRLVGGGYVIYNRRITKPDFSGWSAYYGSNPHTSHLHVSFSRDQAGFDSSAGWGFLVAPTPPSPPPPPRPVVPPFPLPRGHYFGHKNGPARSHGGYYASERPHIKLIQQALIRKGYVPGITDVNSRWADGIYEDPTVAAVTRFQRREMPGTRFFGQVWADDWRKLLG